jgi:probable phosphoglycerate mutase
MPGLGPCAGKSPLGADEQKYLLDESARHQKNGLSVEDADRQAVREFQHKTLDSLQDIYRQIGIKGHEPAAPAAAEPGADVLEARHANTEHDEQQIVSGQNKLGLSDLGKKDAAALRDQVQADHAPTKIISSDLPRSKETADIVADGKIPVETRPELRSWDLGKFGGMKDAEFKPEQKYFVEHPDATEHNGKTLGESFNQYKDRVIQARQNVDDPDAMLINHSNNMAIWDAYQKNGGKWDETAAKDYLASKTPEPATLHSTPEEEATASAVKAGKIPDSEIKKAITDEITSRSGVQPRDQRQPGHDEANGKVRRANEKTDNEGSARASVEGKTAGAEPETGGARVSADTGAADKAHIEFEKEVEAAFAGGRVKGKVITDEGNRVWIEAKDGTKYPVAKKDILKSGESVLDKYPKAKLGEQGESAAVTPKAYSDPGRALETIRTETPDLKRAADFLEPILRGKKNISIENVEGLKDPRSGAAALGLAHPDGRIQVDFAAHRSMDDAHQTIVHELLHQATRTEIETNPAFKQEVSGLLNDIRKAMKLPVGNTGDVMIPALVERGVIPAEKYGASNEHEVIAEVFSNPKFRSMLEDMKAPDAPKENMLQRVVKSIVRFFNRKYDALQNVKGRISATDMADHLMQLTEGTVKAAGTKGDALALAAGLNPEEQAAANFIKRAPDSMSDGELGDILEKHSGLDRPTINQLINDHRETLGAGDDPEAMVKRALEIGKQTYAQSKRDPLAPKMPADTPSTMNKLSRWFGGRQDEVTDVKSIIRTNKGQEEHDLNAIYKASNDLRDMWNKKSREQQLAFQLMMQKPGLLKNQPMEVQAAAEAYRKRFDASFDMIQSVAPKASYLEDYFPGFWKKPDQVRNFFADAVSKSPLEGSKSFLKQKFFDTILDGLRKGYKPITYNPEEMVRLAEANAYKFKTAHDILSDMKDKGLLQYSIGKGDIPNGWQTIKDPLFQRMSLYLDPKTGDPEMAKGAYYMPPEVAKLINDYQSPGLRGPAKTVIQTYNNIKNTFQLGVGGFHFVTTAIDNAVTGTSIGLQKLSHGNILGGIGELAKSASFIPTTVESLYKGFKAVKDYNSGKMTDDVQSLIDANARVGKQRMYTLDAQYNMKKAWGQMLANKDARQILPFLGNSAMYLPEAINKPLMERWVPALKVGGYLRSLKSEIEARPNMTPEELQSAKEKIWDSMDDRLGQVVYDNVFMNKSYKDLAFMAIRSAGWTGGTIRSAVKGAAEIPLSASRLVKGEGITQRTAYMLALPLTVGFFGAAYHYMNTGQAPDSLEDYFYPKDGTKNPDGTDHRVTLPSYMKDYISYGNKPVETLMHKTSPIVNDAVELYQNKDFYGVQIANPKDPMYMRGLERLEYEAKTMVPFSFKSQPYTNPTPKQRIEQGFGLLHAPVTAERTDTQNAISKAYVDQMGHEAEGKTQADLEKQVARKHLREFLFNGGEYDDADPEMKKKADISDKALTTFIKEGKMDPYERYFSHLKSDTKIELYKQMKPADKEKYIQYMPKDWENPDEPTNSQIVPLK